MTEYLDTWTRDRRHEVTQPRRGLIGKIQQLISGLDATKLAIIPDTSHWNTINVQQMVDQGGIAGIICKASDGKPVKTGPLNDPQTYVDDKCAATVDAAYKARIGCGLYHYVQFDYPNWTLDDIVDFQLEKFEYAQRNKYYNLIALDIEEKKTTSVNAWRISSGLYEAMRKEFPDKRMAIYWNMNILNLFEHLYTWVGVPEVKDKYDLWMAQWPWLQGGSVSWEYLKTKVIPGLDMRVQTPGYAQWKLVQWTGDTFTLPGCAGKIDLNFFKGTKEQFWQWLNYIPPVIPPEPEPAPGLRMRVICDTLNLRSGPGTAYADIGDLHKGDVIEVKNIGGTSAWIQTDKGWCCVQLSATRFMEVTNG